MLLVVAPPVVTFWLAPNVTTLHHQADIVGLFVYPVVLTAALHAYFHWRLTDNTAAGVLSVCMFAAAVKGLSRVPLRMEYADAIASHAVPLFLVDVLFALVLLATLILLPHRGLRVDPGGLGLAIGVMFGVLLLVAVNVPRPLDPGLVGAVHRPVVLLGLHLLVALALLQLRPLPGWVRLRLAVAAALLSVNYAVTSAVQAESWYAALAIGTDLMGATLLAGTTMALLRRSTRRRRLELADLRERIDRTERVHQGDREQLHEIVSTVAGIACASRLMNETADLPGHRREQLGQMVDSEIARLERLVQEQSRSTTDVDLDATIRPLVTAHTARGHEAHWTPTGLTAHARQDDVAEVVHVLLDNAARHAAGAPVSITGSELDDGIEIHVRDKGPGIPRELAHRVFQLGQRGPGSTGQGIGLNVAARLMAEMGGGLQLVPTTQGTSFVLRMPKARRGDVGPSSSAQ